MAPGTWSAPGENDTVAWAGGAAYCTRSRTALTGWTSLSAPAEACCSGRGK